MNQLYIVIDDMDVNVTDNRDAFLLKALFFGNSFFILFFVVG